MSLEIRSLFINIINFLLMVANLFLVGRILFELFQANPTTPFVSWVYGISGYFISPFRGLFGSLNLNSGSVLDIPALFAIIIYTIVGYVLVTLINATTNEYLNADDYDEYSEIPDQSHTHLSGHNHSN